MGKFYSKIKIRRILALFLAVMLIMGSVPVEARENNENDTNSNTPSEVEAASEPLEESQNRNTGNNNNENRESGNFDIDVTSLNLDFSGISANKALLKSLIKDVEVDKNDPVLEQVEEELDSSDIIADNDEDDSVGIMTFSTVEQKTGLTEEEKEEILGMFAAYLQHYAENANVLGVQLPFFLNENDDVDDLGVLGEMLVLAGITVDDVRNGYFDYDGITGMILTLMLGDQIGVEAYGDKIKSLRDEALKAVEDSAAKTEAQKLLVLNDWLATEVNFDMGYIMNAGKGPEDNKPMQPEDPQPHNNYQTIYDTVYEMYKESILEELKNGVKEKFTRDMFIQQLGDNAEHMTEKQIDAAYEDAVLDVLASEEMTEELGTDYETFVEMNATGAAEGLTPEILNYWAGSIFDTFGEGSAVCLGYTRAYAYLVQSMHPEIYLKSGSDIDNSDNWKSYKDLYFDDNNEINLNSGYIADAARITFDADVTMYGETQEGFNSDHFWNVVKVDGEWYYIDPPYNDAYVEVMLRDRVETDGNMSHLYFLLSDTTTRELFEGNYSSIRTLYEGIATDDSYEDSWMSRAISNTFSNNGYFYYVYSSQDMIGQLREFGNFGDDGFESDSSMGDYEYKLVRHKITDTDAPNTDTEFEALIEFNYKENEDDDETYARVLKGGSMERDNYLTDLYAEHEAMAQIYPSITISTILHGNKLYFNLSNVILSYDLNNGAVNVVKEIGEISLTRDKTEEYGGMSFSFTEGENEGADFVLDNHPIAAIAFGGNNNNLRVSMATNLAYISGKDDAEYNDDLNSIRQGNYTEDRPGYYGFAFEETNYNPAHTDYYPEGFEGMVEKEINDNDEFMWVANAVKDYGFNELGSGTSTNGKKFEGVLCKDGEHKYVEHEEIYFTRDDNGQWNTGPAYVCVECGYSVFEPTEPSGFMGDNEEAQKNYEEQLAAFNAAKESHKESYVLGGAVWSEDSSSVTFTTLTCKYSFDDYKIDALYELEPVDLDNPIVITGNDIAITKNADGSTTYTADSKNKHNYSGYDYYASTTDYLVRVSGNNRYRTALEIAKESYGNKVDNIVLASGTEKSLVDALSVGPLANELNAPIILVSDRLDEEVLDEILDYIKESGVKKIYVSGGTAALSEDIVDNIKEEANLADSDITRLGGTNRYQTSLEIAKELWEEYDYNKTVLLAEGWDGKVDALAASTYATQEGYPIILTSSAALDSVVLEGLEAAEVTEIVPVGGTTRLPNSVISDSGIEAGDRISGAPGTDRRETAVEIAKKLITKESVIIANGWNGSVDALAAASLAQVKKAPIVLTGTELTESQEDLIPSINGGEIYTGYVVGGPKVVSVDIYNAVNALISGLSE